MSKIYFADIRATMIMAESRKIDHEKCIGCGECVVTCRNKVSTLISDLG